MFFFEKFIKFKIRVFNRKKNQIFLNQFFFMVDPTKNLHVKIEIEDFESTYKDFETKYKAYIGIFKGSLDPETKINWCPDCVAVEEPLKNYFFPLAQSKNIPILEVSVGKKEKFFL